MQNSFPYTYVCCWQRFLTGEGTTDKSDNFLQIMLKLAWAQSVH